MREEQVYIGEVAKHLGVVKDSFIGGLCRRGSLHTSIKCCGNSSCPMSVKGYVLVEH